MTPEKNRVTSVSDKELAEITGGYDKYHDATANRYYLWSNKVDCAKKYLCPNCGRPVNPGFLNITFKCKPCDASWYYEDRLRPNLSSGAWTEVSKEEYDGSGAKPLMR